MDEDMEEDLFPDPLSDPSYNSGFIDKFWDVGKMESAGCGVGLDVPDMLEEESSSDE